MLQFPLYKLFLITAVFAAAFATFGQLGRPGIVIASLLGAIWSAIVLLIRTKKELNSALKAGAFILAPIIIICLLLAFGK